MNYILYYIIIDSFVKMKLVEVYPSDKPGKKYTAKFVLKESFDSLDKVKLIHFGAKGYEDYTIHKNKKRRDQYRARHAKDNLSDPMSPGALSFFILWGDSTDINRNIIAYRRRFNNL